MADFPSGSRITYGVVMDGLDPRERRRFIAEREQLKSRIIELQRQINTIRAPAAVPVPVIPNCDVPVQQAVAQLRGDYEQKIAALQSQLVACQADRTRQQQEIAACSNALQAGDMTLRDFEARSRTCEKERAACVNLLGKTQRELRISEVSLKAQADQAAAVKATLVSINTKMDNLLSDPEIQAKLVKLRGAEGEKALGIFEPATPVPPAVAGGWQPMPISTPVHVMYYDGAHVVDKRAMNDLRMAGQAAHKFVSGTGGTRTIHVPSRSVTYKVPSQQASMMVRFPHSTDRDFTQHVQTLDRMLGV